MRARSAPAFTVVDSLAELSAGFGSSSFAPTAAAFLIVPAASGITVIVTVAEPAAASSPRSQLTVPAAWLQVPWLAVAETKATPAGSASVKLTPVAFEGPWLATVAV